MSGFWESELGEVTGKAEDAFAKTFTIIPDNTTALARIDNFTVAKFGDQSPNAGQHFLTLDWVLTDGDFKGSKVNQKIKICDLEPKVRHRALNMLKLLYQIYAIKPSHSNMPDDNDLRVFVGKFAGIRIRETEPNESGKQYNWVSEVHPGKDFKSETGIKLVVTHNNLGKEGTAFDRNPRGSSDPFGKMEDDIPF